MIIITTFEGELCIIVCSGNVKFLRLLKKSKTKTKESSTYTLNHTFPEPHVLGAYGSAIGISRTCYDRIKKTKNLNIG